MIKILSNMTDEEQIRYVAKHMGFDDKADLKDLPTATIRDLIRKAENKANDYIISEIRKMMTK